MRQTEQKSEAVTPTQQGDETDMKIQHAEKFTSQTQRAAAAKPE